LRLFLLSLIVVVLDQSTKFIAALKLPPGGSIPLIKGVFHLTLLRNKGMAFGLFPEQVNILLILSFFAVPALLTLLIIFSRRIKTGLVKFGLALILGGAIGNLIDRLRYGEITDFLDFRIWPVFNLADTAITVGAILLVLKVLLVREVTDASGSF